MMRPNATAILFVLAIGCGGGAPEDAPESPERASEPADETASGPARTSADFEALRFLEGDWKGSGYEGGPFYESYRVVDDSTLEMTAWTDSTMTTPRDQQRYVLWDGVIRTGDGARLVSVDEDGYHFRGASYGWTFRQVSPDRWTARVGPSTVYTMDRIDRP